MFSRRDMVSPSSVFIIRGEGVEKFCTDKSHSTTNSRLGIFLANSEDY